MDISARSQSPGRKIAIGRMTVDSQAGVMISTKEL